MGGHSEPTKVPQVPTHTWAALTLYMWANSISRGVSSDRGGGFTVTEMTLELRTVVFLGAAKHKGCQRCGVALSQPCSPAPASGHTPPYHHTQPRSLLLATCRSSGYSLPKSPTSAEPGSYPSFGRAQYQPRTQMNRQLLEGGSACYPNPCCCPLACTSPPPPL